MQSFARLVQVRRLSLAGDVDGAERALGKLSLKDAPARLVALAQPHGRGSGHEASRQRGRARLPRASARRSFAGRDRSARP